MEISKFIDSNADSTRKIVFRKIEKGKKNRCKRKHIKQLVQSSKINICRELIHNILKFLISNVITIAKKYGDENANANAKMLVKHVLIKNKQNAVITCKLIFMLSVSDLKNGLFSQNVSIAIFQVKSYLLMNSYLFIFIFQYIYQCIQSQQLGLISTLKLNTMEILKHCRQQGL